MNFITEIINDTLKRKDAEGVLRYSRTSLTMFSAWVAVLWSYIHYTIKDGFIESAFYGMIGVALGSKVFDSWSKKLSPDKPTDNSPAP